MPMPLSQSDELTNPVGIGKDMFDYFMDEHSKLLVLTRSWWCGSPFQVRFSKRVRILGYNHTQFSVFHKRENPARPSQRNPPLVSTRWVLNTSTSIWRNFQPGATGNTRANYIRISNLIQSKSLCTVTEWNNAWPKADSFAILSRRGCVGLLTKC